MEIEYFSAAWCTPCREYGPLLERVIKDYPKAKIIKKNIDDSADQYLAHQYGIRSVPTLVMNNQLFTGARDEPTLRKLLDEQVGA